MTAVDFYRRRKEIGNYHRHQSDILRMMRGYPDVHLRLMVEPEGHLIENGAVPIFATKKDMHREIKQGISAGVKAVEDL